jgi:hypothetical protein
VYAPLEKGKYTMQDVKDKQHNDTCSIADRQQANNKK